MGCLQFKICLLRNADAGDAIDLYRLGSGIGVPCKTLEYRRRMALFGAMAAAAIGTGVFDVSSVILIPTIILFGCAAGAFGMIVPATLKFGLAQTKL